MAVTFVNKAEQTDQLVSSRVVGKPSGVTTDDFGVFFLTRWDSGGSFPAVTAPAGAVLRGTITNGAIETKVYLDYVQAEANWSFSWTGARWSSCSAIFFRGVDLALDLSTVPFNTATGTGTTVSTTSVTTAIDAGLAWNVNTQDYAAATTHAEPTGYTEAYDFDAYGTAYKIATGSSESAASATISSSQIWIAALVALATTSSAGPVDLDGEGSAAAQAGGTALADRPIVGGGTVGADGSGALAAARPIVGQGTASSATTGSAGVVRSITGTLAASAATLSAEGTFERGLVSDARAGAATTAALSVARDIAGDADTAATSTGSLVGGLVEFEGAASAAAATTSAASFTRGLAGSASAAIETSGAVNLGLAFASAATAAADLPGDLSLIKSWYRLVVPQIVEYFTMPGTVGLRTSKVREITVFGDENGLFTSEEGSIAEGADEYGAIPFGTKYIWYGGHENLTDDPTIKDLWLAHGFEVELVQV